MPLKQYKTVREALGDLDVIKYELDSMIDQNPRLILSVHSLEQVRKALESFLAEPQPVSTCRP